MLISTCTSSVQPSLRRDPITIERREEKNGECKLKEDKEKIISFFDEVTKWVIYSEGSNFSVFGLYATVHDLTHNPQY